MKRRQLLAPTITETAGHGRAKTGDLVRSPAHERYRTGRRQERIARRNDRATRRRGCARSGRVRDHRLGISRVPGGNRLERAHRGSAGRPRRRRRGEARPGRRRDPGLDRRGAASRGAEDRDRGGLPTAQRRQPRRIGRCPIVGHRRGPARCLVRWTAGNIPKYQWLGQSYSCDKRGICVALQRSRDRLPRAPGLRRDRGRAVGRRPAHGAQRQGRRRRDVHARHRVRLRSGRVHHRLVRPGRDRRAGRGESRRVLRLQAEPRGRAAGDPAQERGRKGDQDGLRRQGRRRRVGDDRRRAGRRRACAFRLPTPKSRSWRGTRW